MIKLLISLGTFIVWLLSVCSGVALMYYSLVNWWPSVPDVYKVCAILLGGGAGFIEAVKSYES